MSCELISEFVESLEFEDYCKNRLVISAVARQFEIMGEALAQLRRMESPLLDRIDNVPKIIAFRNILAHGYDVIRQDMIWSAIPTHRPVLESQIRELLAAGDVEE